MSRRILLVENHVKVRRDLKALLAPERFQVVAEASDGAGAVREAGVTLPDVAVLDLAVPATDELEIAREVRRVSPGTRIILVTAHGEEPVVLQALRSGVKGYVLKGRTSEDLVPAIQEVSHGSVYLSPGFPGVVIRASRSLANPSSDSLSPRELQVLRLIAEGKPMRELARLLGISVKTAETHRSRIKAKLDVHELAGLVRYAVRRGLIEP